jgi:acyl carrier protein
MFELEKQFQLSLPDEEVRSVRTVREIVEQIRSLSETAVGRPPVVGE